jgi:hypothetical protein
MFAALLATLGAGASGAGAAATGAAATGAAATGAAATGALGTAASGLAGTTGVAGAGALGTATSGLAAGVSGVGSAVASAPTAVASAPAAIANTAATTGTSLISDISSGALNFSKGAGKAIINSNPVTGTLGQMAGIESVTSVSPLSQQAGYALTSSSMNTPDKEEKNKVDIIPFAELMKQNMEK